MFQTWVEISLTMRQASSSPKAFPALQCEGPKGTESIDHVGVLECVIFLFHDSGGGRGGGGVRRDKEEVERLSAGTVAGSCFVANFLSGMALSQSNLLVQSSGRLQGGGGGVVCSASLTPLPAHLHNSKNYIQFLARLPLLTMLMSHRRR